jgi:hypothetical protein
MSVWLIPDLLGPLYPPHYSPRNVTSIYSLQLFHPLSLHHQYKCQRSMYTYISCFNTRNDLWAKRILGWEHASISIGHICLQTDWKTDSQTFHVKRGIQKSDSVFCNFWNLWWILITKIRRDRAFGIATGYWLDARVVGVRVPVGARFFFGPYIPDQFWDPPSFISNGYMGILPRGRPGREAETHLRIAPRSRIRGSIPQFPISHRGLLLN